VGEIVSDFAESLANDVIAQMGNQTFAVSSYSASYQDMFVTDLETMAPAGSAGSEMQVIFAPVGGDTERTAWGAVRNTETLGVLFQIAVDVADGVVNDTNLPSYRKFVNQFCDFLLGPRKFAVTWNAAAPKVIMGDHYNDHLYQKFEFHVPVIVDFFRDAGVS
jgi:hypothetical protein